MADIPLAQVPPRIGRLQVAPLFVDDTSTVFHCELTADTSPERYAHSYDIDDNTTTQSDKTVRFVGLDADYTDSDALTFPGFRPMRDLLTGEPAHYLVSERRWSMENDPREIVGQKNVILIFVCIATVEECFIDGAFQNALPVDQTFSALVNLLGMKKRSTGRLRRHEFLSTIQIAFAKSRSQEIKHHLENGNQPPPESEDLSGLDKMLLDVMDKHIAFQLTEKPLTRLRANLPMDKVLKSRVMQIKRQLQGKGQKCVEECFTTFIPTIPREQQAPWPRCGVAAAWQAAQANLARNKMKLELDCEPGKHPEHIRTPEFGASRDPHSPAKVSSILTIPGIPAVGPLLPPHTAPISPAEHFDAGHLDAGHPDSLSGLRLFKTAVCQVHKVITCSKDGSGFRHFIGQIENDVQKFCAGFQVEASPSTAGSPMVTGILGSELEILMERQHIRSLMSTGLGVISKQWNQQLVNDDLRQKICNGIAEELREISMAADQVCSAEVWPAADKK